MPPKFKYGTKLTYDCICVSLRNEHLVYLIWVPGDSPRIREISRFDCSGYPSNNASTNQPIGLPFKEVMLFPSGSIVSTAPNMVCVIPLPMPGTK